MAMSDDDNDMIPVQLEVLGTLRTVLMTRTDAEELKRGCTALDL
jgi:hypothetical protein